MRFAAFFFPFDYIGQTAVKQCSEIRFVFLHFIQKKLVHKYIMEIPEQLFFHQHYIFVHLMLVPCARLPLQLFTFTIFHFVLGVQVGTYRTAVVFTSICLQFHLLHCVFSSLFLFFSYPPSRRDAKNRFMKTRNNMNISQ